MSWASSRCAARCSSRRPWCRLAPAEPLELEALVRSVTSLFGKVISLSPALPDELAALLENVEGGPGALADLIAASLPTLPIAFKQELLETVDVRERLSKL